MKQNKKPKRSRISIKWKIFTGFGIFTACIVVLLWLTQTVFLEDFYKFIKTQSIRSSANALADNISNSDLEALVTNLSQNSDACIRVIDQDGREIPSKDRLEGCVIHDPSFNGRTFYLKTLQNGGEYLEYFTKEVTTYQYLPNSNLYGSYFRPSQKPTESIVLGKIITAPSGVSILILINSVISPVNATVDTLRIQLICISVVLILLALILSLILSRRVSKPISDINTAAKALAEGNYGMVFDNSGYREISELADTLNYAAHELGKTEGLRRELIANVSHDLRTPLTMITGYSEVMRDLPGENTPENVQIIIDEATRLTNLVNDMLDISKWQAGTQTLNLTTFSLTDAVEQTLKRYNKLTEQDGYTIRFEHTETVWVTADELRISQVVYNLVNNAINYTGDDKKITVRQTTKDGWVKLEIMDTGEGIDPENLPLVWDRYYKIDKQHKRAAIGTGLGLSIVKSILHSHKGTYGVESEKGVGSTFWFALKAAAPPIENP